MKLTITAEAIAHLQKIIANHQSEHAIFRLAVKRSGCSGYRYDPQVVDRPVADDVLVQITPDWAVYVEASAVPLLTGTTIELVEKSLGHQIVFANPNAVDECGCGESFSLKADAADQESS